MDIAKKSTQEMAEWLEEHSFGPKIVEAFLDNEVDGEAFLVLSDDDIRGMVKAIGPRAKLVRRRNELKECLQQKPLNPEYPLVTSVGKEDSLDLTREDANAEYRSGLKSKHLMDDSLDLTSGEEEDAECGSGLNTEHPLSASDEEDLLSREDDDAVYKLTSRTKHPLSTSDRLNKPEVSLDLTSREDGDAVYTSTSKTKTSMQKRQASFLESEDEEDCTCSHVVSVTDENKKIKLLKRIKLDPNAAVAKLQIPSYSKKKQEPPLPRPFELPRNFAPAIQEGLKAQRLAGKPRSKFITAIAQAIFRYKSYPTDEEYRHVAAEIVKTWKFLNLGTGPGYLVVALKQRMAYLRKPDDRKRGSKENKTPSKTPTKHLLPSSPAAPLIPLGEDKASHDRHTKVLQDEFKKVNPNKHVTTELMKRTFPHRRQVILDDSMSMEKLLRMYPALRYPEEIIRELNRIMGTDVGEKPWEGLVPKIRQVAQAEDDNANIQGLLAGVDDTVSEEYCSILAMCLLYYMAPDVRTKPNIARIVSLVNETDDIKIAAKNVPTAQPCLVVRAGDGRVKDSFLVVEKKVLAKCSAKLAPTVLIGAFYAFNVHYTEGCTNFYTLLEILFFNKRPPGRKPRLSALLAQIESAEAY